MAATTATIIAGAVVASTVASGLSKFKGERDAAKDAERQGSYEREIYAANALHAEEQAIDAIERGAAAEGKHRAGVRGLVGKQRAAMAAQGLDLTTGSAYEIQLESLGIGELDALTIRNNAATEAWGFKHEAADLRRQGELAFMGAKSRARSYKNASWSTLLTTGAELGKQYPG